MKITLNNMLQVSNQDFSSKVIRTAAALTTGYVAATVLDGPTGTGMHLNNQLNLMCALTKASLTSVEIKIEYSNDKTTWYQLTNQSVSGATNTLTPGEYTIVCASLGTTQNFVIEVPIKYPFIRVSAKGTGTVTSSSFSIIADYGVV